MIKIFVKFPFDLKLNEVHKNVGNRGFIGVTGLFVHQFVHQLVNLKQIKSNQPSFIYIARVQIINLKKLD